MAGTAAQLPPVCDALVVDSARYPGCPAAVAFACKPAMNALYAVSNLCRQLVKIPLWKERGGKRHEELVLELLVERVLKRAKLLSGGLQHSSSTLPMRGMTRLPRRWYECPTAWMNGGRGNSALGLSSLPCLAHLHRGEWLRLERILMGEVEVVQPLPIRRIEHIVPHLLQQRVEF